MAEIYNFFGNICDYLRENYWEAPFGYYRSFEIDLGFITMGQLVFLIMGAFIAAAVIMYVQKNVIGSLVHALLREKAMDEDSARSLGELGLSRNLLVRHALRRRDSALRKVVRYVGEEARREDGTLRASVDVIDYARARFYIPPALCDRAAIRFSREGTDGRALVLAILFFFVLAFVLIRFLPAVLGWADNLMSLLG